MSNKPNDSDDLIDFCARVMFGAVLLPAALLFLYVRKSRLPSTRKRLAFAVFWSVSFCGIAYVLIHFPYWRELFPASTRAVLTKPIVGLLTVNGSLGVLLIAAWAQFETKRDHSALKKSLF